MNQSRKMSLLESAANVFSGFVISVLAGKVIYPLFGLPVTDTQLSGIVAIFTVIGVVRSYTWRRLFNWIHRSR